ncbi:unnamed protein product, partial [Discosporangium mesarthrocarpum]
MQMALRSASWRHPRDVASLAASVHPCQISCRCRSTTPPVGRGRSTHRSRRVARAHPGAATSRKIPSPRTPRKPEIRSSSRVPHFYAANRAWTKKDFGSPEFLKWVMRFPSKAGVENAVQDDWEEVEEEEENIPKHRVKHLIVPRAKMPQYNHHLFGQEMLASRRKVLTERSTAQLRAAHERLREKEAQASQEGSYLQAPVGWDRQAFSPDLSVGQSGKKARISYGPDETYAHVSHRMIPAYAILCRVLSEAKGAVPGLNPTSMLDFGSGPGTATLAAWETWCAKEEEKVEEEEEGVEDEVSDKEGKEEEEEPWVEGALSEARLVEVSQAMIDASKIMLEPLQAPRDSSQGGNGGLRVGFASSLLEEARSAARVAGERGSRGRKFDLVVAANSLSELSSHPSRAAATALLWGMVSEGGVLVVVENGTAMGSHTVRSAREMVL